jgi:hypothetical protein
MEWLKVDLTPTLEVVNILFVAVARKQKNHIALGSPRGVVTWGARGFPGDHEYSLPQSRTSG